MERGCEPAAEGGSAWNEVQSLGRGSFSSQPLQLCPEEQGEPGSLQRVWSSGSAGSSCLVSLDEDEHWSCQGCWAGPC